MIHPLALLRALIKLETHKNEKTCISILDY